MMMKAIRVAAFGPSSVLELKEVSRPTPGKNEVLVQMSVAGLNPVDCYIRSGTYARKPALPYTPGADGAGVIAAVGPTDGGAQQLRVGDRVFIDGSISGTCAEYALCSNTQVFPLPPAATFEQGASCGVPYGTAFRALFQRGQARPGERVLVHGASGGVGIAAVQLAKAKGLKVYGTAGSAEGLRLVSQQGADGVANHTDSGYREQLMAMTGGAGFDLIVESLANINLGRDLEMLATNGRVLVVGSRGPVEINPRDTMAREADVRGVAYGRATAADLAEIHAAIVQGLANRTLIPIVGVEFPIEETAKAHDYILSPPKGAAGKVVIRIAKL